MIVTVVRIWYKSVTYPKEIIMHSTLDEQTLITNFRRLHPDGKRELLDYALFLVNKYRHVTAEPPPALGNQCSLDQGEKRPEAVKEPIFTE
jgi:hypothetical protein